MYLQTDRIVATVGGIVFRTFKTDTGPQFLLDETAVIGLFDGVDVRRNFTPRQIRSGDFLEHGHHAARYISFSGMAIASSVDELYQMRDDFTGAVKYDTYEPMSIETSYDTRYTTVSVAGKTSWVRQNDTSATFKIDLYAPDPNLYGETRQFTIPGLANVGGTKFPLGYPINYGTPLVEQPIIVSNAGNTNAWPIFIVTGDYTTGFSITDNLGNYVSYVGPVSMSAPVILDAISGSASQGGHDRSTLLRKRDWFPIPPDTVLQPTFIPNEKVLGWCDIIFKDTWV